MYRVTFNTKLPQDLFPWSQIQDWCWTCDQIHQEAVKIQQGENYMRLVLIKDPKKTTNSAELDWKSCLTLYTLKSVHIFSILLSEHFLRCWQGEFVWQSRASLAGDHSFYSCNLYMCFNSDIMRRNYRIYPRIGCTHVEAAPTYRLHPRIGCTHV